MSDPSHSGQELIQYLLGALPEAETERFDALSVADAEFANELSAAEKNLVDAYIQGELTGASLERFESHYLASPLRREKIEFARAFQSYAGRNAATASENVGIEESRPKRAAAGFFSFLNIFQSQTLVLRWSFAAAVVVLLALGGWWSFNSVSQPMVSVVLSPPLRGSNQVPTLSIPNKTSEVAIQLELEAAEYSAYRVALTDASGSGEFWRSSSLQSKAARENKRLEIRLPAGLLKSQIYSLAVSGINPDGSVDLIGNYPFRIDIR